MKKGRNSGAPMIIITKDRLLYAVNLKAEYWLYVFHIPFDADLFFVKLPKNPMTIGNTKPVRVTWVTSNVYCHEIMFSHVLSASGKIATMSIFQSNALTSQKNSNKVFFVRILLGKDPIRKLAVQ